MNLYATRLVTPLEPLRFGTVNLKVYGLSVHQRIPDTKLLDAAREFCRQFFHDQFCHHQCFHDNKGEQTGFVIVHEARPANFVLIHVWQGVDLRQWYFTSPLDHPTVFSPFTRGTVGCVWELGLGIVQHEREAWIRTVLRHGVQAREQYLTDVLSGPT